MRKCGLLIVVALSTASNFVRDKYMPVTVAITLTGPD
jgi:hypothetical protein